MNSLRPEIQKKIGAFKRIPLVHLPTPMRKLERLTAELGGPEIWAKRDDLTGLAFGGNKSRKLEFIIADALAKKADVVVTWGALQSNWAMQTAAACAKCGLPAVLQGAPSIRSYYAVFFPSLIKQPKPTAKNR